MGDSILKLSDVIKRTGKSRTQIYSAIQRNAFPKQVQLDSQPYLKKDKDGVEKLVTPRAVGWLESDINAWIAACTPKRTASSLQHAAV